MQLWLPILVTLLYLSAAVLFAATLKREKINIFWPLVVLVFACQAHAILLIQLIYEGNQQLFNLSIFNVISLFTWAVACTSLLWLWQKKMAMGGVIICLVNTVLAPLASIFIGHKSFLESITSGLFYHIGLSIVAWTLLTIAFVYCVLYLYLYHRLKQKKIKDIMHFASLANLERVMMIYHLIGWLFLMAALITGFFFVHDFFAQHLWHKTVLTVIAAAIYAYMLYAYFVKQSCGTRLVYITLLGYAFLILGYVVSNIIVQFLLSFSLTR